MGSRGRRLDGERSATGRAEFRGRSHFTSTARTRVHEFGSAFLAELGLRLILKATARTVHAASLLLRALRSKETACPQPSGSNLLLRARALLHPIDIRSSRAQARTVLGREFPLSTLSICGGGS